MLDKLSTELIHRIAYHPTSPLPLPDVLALASSCKRLNAALLGSPHARALAYASLGLDECISRGLWRSAVLAITRSPLSSQAGCWAEIKVRQLFDAADPEDADWCHLVRLAQEAGACAAVSAYTTVGTVYWRGHIKMGPASLAACYGLADLAVALVDSADGRDRTYALNAAASNGLTDLARYLLDDPQLRPMPSYHGPLEAAAANGHVDVVAMLLADGRIKPGASDCNIMNCAALNGHRDVIEFLLNDARMNPLDNNMAFETACKKGHADVAALLLAHPSVDPAANHYSGLLQSASLGHADVVALLLANPRVHPAVFDNAAIRFASEYGRTEVVRVLLADPRVDISADNNYAIRMAAQNNHTEVVSLLRDAGCPLPHAPLSFSIFIQESVFVRPDNLPTFAVVGNLVVVETKDDDLVIPFLHLAESDGVCGTTPNEVALLLFTRVLPALDGVARIVLALPDCIVDHADRELAARSVLDSFATPVLRAMVGLPLHVVWLAPQEALAAHRVVFVQDMALEFCSRAQLHRWLNAVRAVSGLASDDVWAPAPCVAVVVKPEIQLEEDALDAIVELVPDVCEVVTLEAETEMDVALEALAQARVLVVSSEVQSGIRPLWSMLAPFLMVPKRVVLLDILLTRWEGGVPGSMAAAMSIDIPPYSAMWRASLGMDFAYVPYFAFSGHPVVRDQYVRDCLLYAREPFYGRVEDFILSLDLAEHYPLVSPLRKLDPSREGRPRTVAEQAELGKDLFVIGGAYDDWIHQESTYVVKVAGGRLEGRGYIVDGSKVILPFPDKGVGDETLFVLREHLEHGAGPMFPPCAIFPVDAPVFSLLQVWDSVYYHIVLETLQRLVFSLDFLRQHPNVLIALRSPKKAPAPQYVIDLLTRLELIDRVLWVAEEECLLPTGKHGMYVPAASLMATFTPAAAELYHAIFVSPAVQARPPTPQDAVVYTQRTKTRQVSNNDAVVELLLELFGDRVVVFSDDALPPILETANVFGSAGLVVGPAGSGHANLVFCSRRQALALVELEPDRSCACHYKTAHAVGGRFYFTADTTSSAWMAPFEADLDILPGLLLELFGDQVVVFSDDALPPILETANVFGSAGLVVGPAGSGHANLVFCSRRQALALVELEPDRSCACHYKTAHAVGGRFYFTADTTSSAWMAPFEADLDILRALLLEADRQRRLDLEAIAQGLPLPDVSDIVPWPNAAARDRWLELHASDE
ncbi:uncharacterized protein AMSG_12358 [Thecamonas trahens ATCC 50062]|uniref:Glycosyltransferase 61 catalytic domain-containing protein n=1 Tax=Thecamonas trahens ATCC 50062 TaxID=461836 RepID=A0A0L0DRC1_THETB|nr:hypothetical protein AMSG_12358 [Thecamonas trahens ATCC 50062]KNC54864.1 hypothetical protein AMSG_12358 [Thecamonas trahens ATCC 50062]|eukprot:XP_013753522.1 hypothetical protein AMSG_12358 [Thecamonas trahens ATCC 50062]